jgi:hypothetical protein
MRAGMLVFSVSVGGGLAVMGVHRPIRTIADGIVVVIGVLGLVLTLDRVRLAARASRLVRAAQAGGDGELTTRPATEADAHVTALLDGSAPTAIVARSASTKGGPFRGAREERAILRVPDGVVSVDVAPPIFSFVVLFFFALFGLYHASTSLSPDHPPYEVATRFQHLPIFRVGLRDPVFEIDGWSMWSAADRVVAYEESTGRVVDDRAWMLASLPPTRSVEVVARRAAMILHACTHVASTRADGPLLPRIEGAQITYACTRTDGLPVQTYTEPVAPQRYTP